MFEQIGEELTLPVYDIDIRISRWAVSTGQLEDEMLLVTVGTESKLYSREMELMSTHNGSNEYWNSQEVLRYLVGKYIEKEE